MLDDLKNPLKTQLRQHYLQAILAGKRNGALELVMDAFKSGYQIPGIYTDIFQESLYEIGRLWETNQITVADEHTGTAITQYVMSNLYPYLEMTAVPRGKLVMTGVPGELHQVGANMIADILEADGWDTLFLGTNVPVDGVVAALHKHNADLLGISSTMLFNLPKVLGLVEAVKREFGDSVRILLGGGAFKTLKQLPEELEGCLVALDLNQAVQKTRNFSLDQ